MLHGHASQHHDLADRLVHESDFAIFERKLRDRSWLQSYPHNKKWAVGQGLATNSWRDVDNLHYRSALVFREGFR